MIKWLWIVPLFLINGLYGQLDKLTFNDIKLSESASLQTVPAMYDTFGTVVLREQIFLGYIYDENDEIRKYELNHEVIRVSSQQAIEENNKVYLPGGNAVKYHKEQVRVINPDGKIIELGEDDIKIAIDEEDESEYRYFALSGLEEGSQIEKLFLMEKVPSFTGRTWYLQSDVPKLNVVFHVESPPNLEFDFKSYNGLPEVIPDTSYEELNVWGFIADTLEPIDSEPYADYAIHLGQIAFKLGRNLYFSPGELFSYSNISREIYDNFHPELSRADEREIDKLMQIPEIKYAKNEEDKIREIENEIKEIVGILKEGEIEEHLSVDEMLEKGVSTESQITRLFCSIFKYIDVEHQIVMTCSKGDFLLDPDFESPHFLKEFLIYFPSIDKYMAPTEQFYRLGYFPSDWANNNGVYIEPVGLGDIKTGIPNVKRIEPLPAKMSYTNLKLNINFIENNTANRVDFTREMMGLSAISLQPIIQYIDDVQLEDLKQNLAELVCENPQIKSFEFKNTDSDDFGSKPLKMEADFTTSDYIQHAGENILFNIGKTIGEQTELYQEDERRLPVSTFYNHTLDRTIIFIVPDEYTVTNLDDLNFLVEHEIDGKKVNGFISKFEKNGNKIIVSIHEYYKQQHIPTKHFKGWQRVINAAADFNKVVLVLEKSL